MRIAMGVFLLFGGLAAIAKPLTASDIMKSSFCKEYACDNTSAFKDKEGQISMQMRLAKDPLNLDLLIILDGQNLKSLTFRFQNDESKVDRKALVSLLTFLLGHTPNSQIVDKIVAEAVVKTKKEELLAKEAVPLEALFLRSGNVLKKPTILIDYQSGQN